MEEITLNARTRTVRGKRVKQLRRKGLIPAILYGHGIEAIPLEINERDLKRTVAQARAIQLIALRIDAETTPRSVLLKEVQRGSTTRSLLHVDFQQVVMGEKITVEVPLVLVGKSPIVEQGRGIFFRGVDAVTIQCLPSELIRSVEVDISKLNQVGDIIYVADLTIPPGIELLTEGEEVVAQILPIEEEVEEVEEVVEEAAEVEAIPPAEEE